MNSFIDETMTEIPARICLISMVYTQIMSHKRSFALALAETGCSDLTPLTYTDVDEWEALADTTQLWFLKDAAADNSEAVYAVRSVEQVPNAYSIYTLPNIYIWYIYCALWSRCVQSWGPTKRSIFCNKGSKGRCLCVAEGSMC